MDTKIRCAPLALTLALVYVLWACAQPRPEVTPPPAHPPAPKPAQIVIQTSPNAEFYLDDTFKGKAQGRLVIDNPQPGEHALRISLTGKKDYARQIAVVARQEARIESRPGSVGPIPGQTRENPKDGLKYVWIPPGTFMMGCSPGDNECGAEEKPAHQVTITRGFWMGQTPVTVGAYKRFAAATGRQMPPEAKVQDRSLNPGWGNEAKPITNVNWDDAHTYCSWAGGRLPTEAEWEYAARAGSTAARYGNLDEIAWYADDSGGQPLDSARIVKEDGANFGKRLDENGNGIHEVTGKRANAFGLYDMLGNVWEFVNDWFDPNYYQNSPSQDPPGPPSGTLRLLRGGSWLSVPRLVRASMRHRGVSASRIDYIYGLRCGGEAGAGLF